MAKRSSLLFALLLVGVILWFWIRFQAFENRLTHAFEVIDVGASEEVLVGVAGDPSYITDGTLWVDPAFPKDDAELVDGCAKEYWYTAGVVFFPAKWSFCYNDAGELIAKNQWLSW